MSERPPVDSPAQGPGKEDDLGLFLTGGLRDPRNQNGQDENGKEAFASRCDEQSCDEQNDVPRHVVVEEEVFRGNFGISVERSLSANFDRVPVGPFIGPVICAVFNHNEDRLACVLRKIDRRIKPFPIDRF